MSEKKNLTAFGTISKWPSPCHHAFPQGSSLSLSRVPRSQHPPETRIVASYMATADAEAAPVHFLVLRTTRTHIHHEAPENKSGGRIPFAIETAGYVGNARSEEHTSELQSH